MTQWEEEKNSGGSVSHISNSDTKSSRQEANKGHEWEVLDHLLCSPHTMLFPFVLTCRALLVIDLQLVVTM